MTRPASAYDPRTEEARKASVVRRFDDKGAFRWEGVPLKEYKPDGTHFRDITRQVLFGEEEGLPTQLRYFEMAPGGYSTFERHEHVHAVMILRGRGQALVGDAVHDVAEKDLVYIEPMTWHQFQAADDASLGFLCLVDCSRDRPQRPTEEQAAALRAESPVGPHIRL
jgi:quercetin dioxygenase-like cupin family protein